MPKHHLIYLRIYQIHYYLKDLRVYKLQLGYLQEYFFEALKQKGIENYDRAVVSLLKCVELDDTEAAVYFELGKSYIQLKNFGAAENSLKLAIDKNPNNEWYLNKLYGVYEQIDDYDNALKIIKSRINL